MVHFPGDDESFLCFYSVQNKLLSKSLSHTHPPSSPSCLPSPDSAAPSSPPTVDSVSPARKVVALNNWLYPFPACSEMFSLLCSARTDNIWSLAWLGWKCLRYCTTVLGLVWVLCWSKKQSQTGSAQNLIKRCLLIQQAYTGHPLYTKHCARCWENKEQGGTVLLLQCGWQTVPQHRKGSHFTMWEIANIWPFKKNL